MAVVKLGNTKSAKNSINYCKKKSELESAFNCLTENPEEQFKTTRLLWNKNSGIQAHTVIQSFKPDEVTTAEANKIGLELAKKIAKEHEVIVYTHSDCRHIHNHIIINSVNFETGKKYQSNMKDLYKIREQSDLICKEHGLSVIEEFNAKLRFTLAEQGIILKGQTSWKDELRQVIDLVKEQSKDFNDFKFKIKSKYDIEVNDTRKHITFKHPDNGKIVRGKTLGLDYEKEGIEIGISRQNEKQSRPDNKITRDEQRKSNSVRKQPTERSISTIERTVRGIDEQVKSLTRDGREKQVERQRKEQETNKRIEQERVRLEKQQRDIESANRNYNQGFNR